MSTGKKYNSISELISDVVFLITKWHSISSLFKEKRLKDDFRERLMLTVTSVNQCRY